MAPKIYVASPLGFAEPTRAYYSEILLTAIRDAGLVPLDPWAGGEPIIVALQLKDPHERRTALRRANEAVGARNAQLLGECHGVLAILDGPDVDSGTAAEIGWAAAKGLPIVGWRSDFRLTGDNEASVVNLQLQYFIEWSGGGIAATLDDAIAMLRGIVTAPSP